MCLVMWLCMWSTDGKCMATTCWNLRGLKVEQVTGAKLLDCSLGLAVRYSMRAWRPADAWMNSPLALSRTAVGALLACGCPLLVSFSQLFTCRHTLNEVKRFGRRSNLLPSTRLALCDYIAQNDPMAQRAGASGAKPSLYRSL